MPHPICLRCMKPIWPNQAGSTVRSHALDAWIHKKCWTDADRVKPPLSPETVAIMTLAGMKVTRTKR